MQKAVRNVRGLSASLQSIECNFSAYDGNLDTLQEVALTILTWEKIRFHKHGPDDQTDQCRGRACCKRALLSMALHGACSASRREWVIIRTGSEMF